MNKAEYLILRSAITGHEWLRQVAYKFGLSQAEVADAAIYLFQYGYVIARVFEDKKDHQGIGNIILTPAEIQANLEGKIRASYELTTQGGHLWASVACPNWNQYFEWYDLSTDFVEIDELLEGELIGVDRQLIENLLSISSYIKRELLMAGTEVWDVIEPWQVTYWKTLPKAYKVRYQAKCLGYLDTNTSIAEYEAYQQAQKWYKQIQQWYTDPDFEKLPLNLANYPIANDCTPQNETTIKNAEYFILKRVVEHYGHYNDHFSSVVLDHDFSHSEILTAAYSLFHKGYILADVHYQEGKVLGVPMTLPEIQANLDHNLLAYYY